VNLGISWYQWPVNVGGHMMREGRCAESTPPVDVCFAARSKCLDPMMQIDCSDLPRPISVSCQHGFPQTHLQTSYVDSPSQRIPCSWYFARNASQLTPSL
jgi:hypothetical protein